MKGLVLTMKKASSPKFRSAINGYNKTDVNNYIKQLSLELEEHETEYKTMVDETAKKADEEKLNAEIAAKTALQDENAELKKSLEEANSLVKSGIESLDAAKEENQKLQEEIASLRAKLDEYLEYEERIKQYEAMSAKMGNIYMSAAADADNIRKEAKIASENLIKDTEAQCREKRIKIEHMLREYSEAKKADFLKIYSEFQADIDTLLADFSKKTRTIGSNNASSGIDSIQISSNTDINK